MKDLNDEAFVQKIFEEGDRLDKTFIKEAKKRRAAILPLLRDIVSNEENYQKEDDEFWGVVHAVHLLGLLKDEKAVDLLLKASEFSHTYDIEWIWDAVPECFSLIGPSSLPALIGELHKENKIESKIAAVQGLWNIYETYPETREEIEETCIQVLQKNVHPELKAIVVVDLLTLGRKDLEDLFNELFDRGEIDMDVLPREDMEYFLSHEPKIPSHFIDIESFYSDKAIKERQKRWKKEEEHDFALDYFYYLLENGDKIGRNEPCPCGSGRKFKKCCLPLLETYKPKWNEKQRDIEEAYELQSVISTEREYENKIRQLLARYERIDLFDGLKQGILELVKAPEEEFVARGPLSYIKGTLEEIDFLDEKEYQELLDYIQTYWNAIAFQMRVSPKDGYTH